MKEGAGSQRGGSSSVPIPNPSSVGRGGGSEGGIKGPERGVGLVWISALRRRRGCHGLCALTLPARLGVCLRLSGLTAAWTVDDPQTPPRLLWEGACVRCGRASGGGGGIGGAAQSARPAGGVLMDGRSWGMLSTSLPQEHLREQSPLVSPLRLDHLDGTLRATLLASPSVRGVVIIHTAPVLVFEEIRHEQSG